jgi:NAD(P)-dependent dehydrogenase (short-subunit alcohol dehydrogenase family)
MRVSERVTLSLTLRHLARRIFVYLVCPAGARGADHRSTSGENRRHTDCFGIAAHPFGAVDRPGDMDLEGQPAIVTGGSRGLGLALVEDLVARRARVTVVARDAGRLAEVQRRLGVSVVAGDMTDATLAGRLLEGLRPTVLILNAGASPALAPLHEQTWEGFTGVWETDVRAAFHWLQAALRLPLARGARILVGSSGAAVGGSPLSGGYAGAKRMLWLLADYANGAAADLGLGIRFQALLPMQLVGETDLGRAAVDAYARRRGITPAALLAAFGDPMPPRRYSEHVMAILTDPELESGTAFGIRGSGITPLDVRA